MDPNFHVTSATFNHKFTNFSQIQKLTQSPACWIQNMPWKIFIEPVVRDNKKYLSIFVSCAASVTSNPWSCKASVKTYKLEGTRPKVIKTSKYLIFDSSASTSWGHDTFILWDTVLKPSNGYIKNDAITIEVSIDAEIPVGLELTSTYFTDERANAAIKLCDQTISSLQSKIQELSNQNNQLQNLNEASSDEITRLQNLLDVSEKKFNDLGKLYTGMSKTNADLKKTIQDSNEQLKQVKDKNSELINTLNESKTNLASLSLKLEDAKSLELELSNCKKEREDLHNKYTSLSTEFENFKNISSNTESENDSKLKAEMNTIKKENNELKQSLTSIQNDANDKSTQIDALIKQLNVLNDEKSLMQKNLDSIHKTLLDSENIIDQIKNETRAEQKRIELERKEMQNQIQSLKSQLYEALVKLKILQDMSDDNEKLKKANDQLMNQMHIGYQKYNNLKQEKAELDSKLDSLNKQFSEANENIKNSKKDVEAKQAQVENCESELTKLKDDHSNLQKINENLNSQLNQAKSKINSFEQTNSQDLTNLVNEKIDLNNENISLRSQLEEAKKDLQIIRDKKLDEEISRLNSEKQNLQNELNKLSQDLEDTKKKLLEATQEVERMIVNERSVSDLQSKLDASKNALKKIEDEKLDEEISKLNSDKQKLQDLLSSLKQELKETKTKLNNAQTQTTHLENIKDENLKHKKQIADLQTLLDETNSRIKSVNDLKNKKGTNNEEANLNEDPDFEVDLVKGIGNNQTATSQKGKNAKTTESSGQRVEKNLGKMQVEDSVAQRLEAMGKQFEKEVKEADEALHEERESLTKRVEDLLFQLKMEKQKCDDLLKARNKLKEQICIVKEEVNSLRKLKDDCITQMNTSQSIVFDIFHLIITILKDLKSAGKLSCSLEAFIISTFETIKRNKFWNIDGIGNVSSRSDNQQVNTDLNADDLEKKLLQMQAYYEENLKLIKNNCALENNENIKLRSSNNELLVALDNEMNMTKQYRRMLIIANSRVEEFRRQTAKLENKFFEEKSRRYESEEISRISNQFREETEHLMDDLKQKLLKHAIELSDIDDTVNKQSTTLKSSINESCVEKNTEQTDGLIPNKANPGLDLPESALSLVPTPPERLETEIDDGIDRTTFVPRPAPAESDFSKQTSTTTSPNPSSK